MNLLVLGTTGSTGRHVLALALEAGHDVTVVVRNPEQLTGRDERVRVEQGSVMDSDLLNHVVPGHEAVISTLGTRRSPSGIGSFALMTRTMKALVPAMERNGVHRLIVLSALGVGESARISPSSLRILFSTIFRPVGNDKAASEAYVRRSALDWTIVYVPVLSNRPTKGSVRHGVDLHVKGMPRVARVDVARFMLAQLEDRAYSRQNAVLSS